VFESGFSAFIDSCGNCVGGNTGEIACIPFSPTVSVSLSNTDCDSLTDLTINVSQDPNEPDMSTSLFVSNSGAFTISLMTVGDNIGTTVMTFGGGVSTFNADLFVSSIISVDQAIVQAIDVLTGLVLGTFTISNSNPGISIIANSIPDNNNVTAGNSQSVTFTGIFLNPSQGTLVFTSTNNTKREILHINISRF
jgi:hypothetical protein